MKRSIGNFTSSIHQADKLYVWHFKKKRFKLLDRKNYRNELSKSRICKLCPRKINYLGNDIKCSTKLNSWSTFKVHLQQVEKANGFLCVYTMEEKNSLPKHIEPLFRGYGEVSRYTNLKDYKLVNKFYIYDIISKRFVKVVKNDLQEYLVKNENKIYCNYCKVNSCKRRLSSVQCLLKHIGSIERKYLCFLLIDKLDQNDNRNMKRIEKFLNKFQDNSKDNESICISDNSSINDNSDIISLNSAINSLDGFVVDDTDNITSSSFTLSTNSKGGSSKEEDESITIPNKKVKLAIESSEENTTNESDESSDETTNYEPSEDENESSDDESSESNEENLKKKLNKNKQNLLSIDSIRDQINNYSDIGNKLLLKLEENARLTPLEQCLIDEQDTFRLIKSKNENDLTNNENISFIRPIKLKTKNLNQLLTDNNLSNYNIFDAKLILELKIEHLHNDLDNSDTKHDQIQDNQLSSTPINSKSKFFKFRNSLKDDKQNETSKFDSLFKNLHSSNDQKTSNLDQSTSSNAIYEFNEQNETFNQLTELNNLKSNEVNNLKSSELNNLKKPTESNYLNKEIKLNFPTKSNGSNKIKKLNKPDNVLNKSQPITKSNEQSFDEKSKEQSFVEKSNEQPFDEKLNEQLFDIPKKLLELFKNSDEDEKQSTIPSRIPDSDSDSDDSLTRLIKES